MGLTKSSTGTNLLTEDFESLKIENGYTIALAGNPNVGKSTIFNSLTGMHQHTGNWPGKTIANATGKCVYNDTGFLFVDIPGTYSILSNSEEEEIARNYICNGNPDCVIVVVDATCLERNLNLVFQIMQIATKVIVCVNLLDEAKKKKINVDLDALQEKLGVPVVGTIARKRKTLNHLLKVLKKVCDNEINPMPNRIENVRTNTENPIEILQQEGLLEKTIKKAEKICKEVCTFEDENYSNRDRKIDKIVTSKKWGIPIMLLFLGIIFCLTIIGANYPSQLLFTMFNWIQDKLLVFANWINLPHWLSNLLIDGVYQTLTWVVSVMLPPMAIFFPLFTFLEDLGYLPRIAFNMDGVFKKCCCTGKQMITMCMGFGCNAAGVVGCRIINSPRERLIAILTNNFVPCNGRFPFLITIATIFMAGMMQGIGASFVATLVVIGIILLGIFLTLLVSKILSKTILKGMPSSFILELPPYRKPQFGKIFVRSILDRTLFVLGRAVAVAAPAGLVIWLFANIGINGDSLLTIVANFLEPFAKLMGLDGYILTAFILGIPANEIVLPIILMCYLKGGALVNIEDTLTIGQILIQNGWTILTAINVMIFTVLHFPCTTTLLTIKKEAGGWKWAIISFIIPTVCGIVLCIFTNLIYQLFI